MVECPSLPDSDFFYLTIFFVWGNPSSFSETTSFSGWSASTLSFCKFERKIFKQSVMSNCFIASSSVFCNDNCLPKYSFPPVTIVFPTISTLFLSPPSACHYCSVFFFTMNFPFNGQLATGDPVSMRSFSTFPPCLSFLIWFIFFTLRIFLKIYSNRSDSVFAKNSDSPLHSCPQAFCFSIIFLPSALMPCCFFANQLWFWCHSGALRNLYFWSLLLPIGYV